MYLKAKITAKVTSSKEDYGSLALCPLIMRRLKIKEYEQCIVNGKESRNDITYIIKGEVGEIGMRGNLSTKHKVGNKIHILIFGNKHIKPRVYEKR